MTTEALEYWKLQRDLIREALTSEPATPARYVVCCGGRSYLTFDEATKEPHVVPVYAASKFTAQYAGTLAHDAYRQTHDDCYAVAYVFALRKELENVLCRIARL